MDIRKIGKMKNGSVKYVTLPSDWAEPKEYVNIEVVSKDKLLITKVKDISECQK